jgi:hypothetical protein
MVDSPPDLNTEVRTGEKRGNARVSELAPTGTNSYVKLSKIFQSAEGPIWRKSQQQDQGFMKSR